MRGTLVTRYNDEGEAIHHALYDRVHHSKRVDDEATGLVLAKWPLTGVERTYVKKNGKWCKVSFEEWLEWLKERRG